MLRFTVLVTCGLGCGRVDFDPRALHDAATADVTDGGAACRAIAVGIGANHACVTLDTGATYCAGANADAQLGTGAIGTSSPTAVLASELARPHVELRLGATHTCIRDAAGAVGCLGDNGNEQLGTTIPSVRETMLQVAAIPAATELAVGVTFGCAATAGQLYCWGDTDEGQAGTGDTTSDHQPEQVPAFAGRAVVSIGAGTGHVCAARDDGSLACWGDGRNLRLGATAGDTCPMASSGSIACAVMPQEVSAISLVDLVTAGNAHTCARRTNGELWCWGANFQGQVGRATSSQEAPALVPNAPSGIVDVVAHREHTCALDGDGEVSCWGSAALFQLGGATSSATPVVVSLPAKAIAIAGHPLALFTCALLDTGEVSCWGDNQQGQLGRGAISMRELPGIFAVPCP